MLIAIGIAFFAGVFVGALATVWLDRRASRAEAELDDQINDIWRGFGE